jgi:peptide subunit release factor 1 (eRF1)
MEVTTYIAELLEGRAVGGLKDTLRALNEGCVRRLIICASLEPSAGGQCQDCQALYDAREGMPAACLYCRSTNFTPVELRPTIITRAYRLGCSLEILSRCPPELEQAGGIAALLH